jgi:hypothetical protein
MLSRLLSKFLYKFQTLISGPISSKQLSKLLAKKLEGANDIFFNIKWNAYQRELSHYLIAQDIYFMKEVYDPFISSPIITRYKDEFISFASKQDYQPGGIINTALIVLYSLIRHVKPDIFIESGTKFGYSSAFIAEALMKNGTKSKMYCLSLFEKEERASAIKRLKNYKFVTVIEGPSEKTIDEIIRMHGSERVGILVDGPKAKSKSWDILTDKISSSFRNLLFLCFDAVQEHIPYFFPDENLWNSKRCINIERLKTHILYQQKYKHRGYKLAIQSNQFCSKYSYLNSAIYEQRNAKWGTSFPWGPFQFDLIKNHIAFSYKLGLIYHPESMSETQTL